MALLCLDASAVLAWLLREQTTAKVRSFWAGLDARQDQLIGAHALFPECTSILREKTYDRLLDHDEAMALVNVMLQLPVRIVGNHLQFTQAIQIAHRTQRRKAYDMQYVALAESEEAELVTLDNGMRQAAVERHVTVRFLG